MSCAQRRLIRVVPAGPVLVEGPVHIELPDGTTVDSDRFMVAICICRRSKNISAVRHQPSRAAPRR